jgi:hypothetical protein
MAPLNPDFIAWCGRQIEAALDSGRITPASAPSWRLKLEADPGPTSAALRSLAAVATVARSNREHAEASR